MSLLFGNLTQEFVSFGFGAANYLQDTNNATAYQELQIAAANFRNAAALDASYLVYIGTCPLIHSTYLLILYKVLGPLSAHSSTWLLGPTLAK